MVDASFLAAAGIGSPWGCSTSINSTVSGPTNATEDECVVSGQSVRRADFLMISSPGALVDHSSTAGARPGRGKSTSLAIPDAA